LTSNLSFQTGFLKTNVVAWDIQGGNPGTAVNFRASFDNAAVVPEPSSYALLIGGTVVSMGWCVIRRKRVTA
jgi:hypothetical protein